jgi:hypothetical protein
MPAQRAGDDVMPGGIADGDGQTTFGSDAGHQRLIQPEHGEHAAVVRGGLIHQPGAFDAQVQTLDGVKRRRLHEQAAISPSE